MVMCTVDVCSVLQCTVYFVCRVAVCSVKQCALYGDV